MQSGSINSGCVKQNKFSSVTDQLRDMQIFNNTFLLRLAVAIILLMHSVTSIFNNSIKDFGNLYLNQVGFAPLGIPLAWAIKLSHIISAFCFLFNKYTRLMGVITIIILIAGIIMIHFKEGWFVVGFGRNGVEFNFLLIFSILTIMFPNGLKRDSYNRNSV